MFADCSQHRGRLLYVPRLPAHISHLDLSYNALGSLPRIPDNFFANVSALLSLNISHNQLQKLPTAVGASLRSLAVLVVDDNPGLELASLRGALSLPNLVLLHARSCCLPGPPPGVFRGLNSSEMLVLDWSTNPRDVDLDLSGFCPLQNLYSLALADCDFRHVTSSCVLQLSILDLTDNDLRGFPNTCRGDVSLFPWLKVLILKRNKIEVLSTEHVCLPSLSILDLSQNWVKIIATSAFSGSRLPSLQDLYLLGQASRQPWLRVTIRVETRAFNHPQLRLLDLSRSGLVFAPDQSVANGAFSNCPRLESLILDGNDFWGVSEDRFVQLFGHLRSLSRLSLVYTKLDFFSKQTFRRFRLLRQLHLSGNLISSLPTGVLDSLHHLQDVDLSDNQLTTVGEGAFSEQLLHRLDKLYLHHNPLQCTCNLLWFRELMKRHEKLLTGPGVTLADYTCSDRPGTNVTAFNPENQACLLARETSVAIILLITSILLAITSTALLFRFRWHLRLLLYEAFRGDSQTRRRHLAGRFLYDVFVSYACQDMSWVQTHLIPELEGVQGLRLCVHERDFIPGRNIVDNIAESVEQSKKILLVFSRDFVQSPWCQFELAFCLRHAMDHDDVLIIVCVDDVASRRVTTTMMAVMKTTTYIQWSKDPQAVTSFWGRLHLALQEIAMNRERAA